MKKHFTFCLFAVGITIIPASLLFAQTDKLILDSKNSQRPAVAFPHDIHFEGNINCTDCHHAYENGKNILAESTLLDPNNKATCSGCHNPKHTIGLKNAFHLQCIGCHTQLARQNKKTGPRLCGQCHIRQ